MKRRYLRPIRTLRKKDFYVFDVETGNKDATGKIKYELSARPESLIFGCIVGGPDNYKKVIESVDDFKKEFKKRRYRNCIVYAHNAEYDLSAVYGNIYEMDNEAIFNGKFIKATNGNCVFADSFNVLPASVEKLGLMLGLPKGSLGSNLVSHISKLNEDIKYCFRDCEIVHTALTQAFTDCEPSFTIGSLSMKIFRHNYLPKNIKINADESDAFFESYYGGRTEAFKLGKCSGNVYDINSAYPKAMRDLVFPDPASLVKKKVTSIEEFCKILIQNEGQLTCTLEVKDMHIPVLPVRHESKLLFPTGTLTGTWTFYELRYCLEHGYITIDFSKSAEAVYSTPIASPFYEFIEDNYEKRKKSKNEFIKYFLKLLMNNLYGKLVQRIDEKFVFMQDMTQMEKLHHEYNFPWAELVPVNGGFFACFPVRERMLSHTVACWGAYITAYVRIELHKALTTVQTKALYCDTDSIFVQGKLHSSFQGDELGEWKKENKVVTNIRGLKDYEFTNLDDNARSMKLKGVKKDAKQLPDSKDGKSVYEYTRMIKTRESFRRKDKLAPGTFIKQKKIISGDYTKREVLKNGKTKPFKF